MHAEVIVSLRPSVARRARFGLGRWWRNPIIALGVCRAAMNAPPVGLTRTPTREARHWNVLIRGFSGPLKRCT